MCKKYDIYTMSQLATRLMQLYNLYNNHCFGGVLPKAVITVEQGKGKAYGWTYNKKMWRQGKREKYSIVLASEHLNQVEIMEITLLHEMCHIYAMEQGIQDTSRGGYYHNKEFAKIAESAGLVVTKEPQGAATRSMTEELKRWIDEQCPIRSIRLVWKKGMQQQSRGEEQQDEEQQDEEQPEEGSTEKKPKKKSGYFVQKCPCCGTTVRTTKADLTLICIGTKQKPHSPQLLDIER